jgi:hypothetical protein
LRQAEILVGTERFRAWAHERRNSRCCGAIVFIGGCLRETGRGNLNRRDSNKSDQQPSHSVLLRGGHRVARREVDAGENRIVASEHKARSEFVIVLWLLKTV